MRDSHSFKVIWSVVLGTGVLVGMVGAAVTIVSFVSGGPEQVVQTFKIIVTPVDTGLGAAVEELRALIRELREAVAIARELVERQ